MTTFHVFLLAIIQGLTEFLPVSSSAHLELWHKFVGETEDDLALDVAVHLGTLGAVILYFWRDVKLAFFGGLNLLRGRLSEPGVHLAIALVVATFPVVVIGLIMHVTGIFELVRSLAVIGWAMIGFGILLWLADRNPLAQKEANEWTLKDAAKLGLWQVLALIPGTSRAGITITGGLFAGYTREATARIAMLMSIPTILASGAVLSIDVIGSADWELAGVALMAAGFAMMSALLALVFMMKLLKSVSFLPYVVYRIILGAVILGFAYLS
ncbi:MAG: undecaprenyl-diphosphate phosphatase [Pseudomonadota bacterium]